jgi:hypothetical protein
MKRPQFPLRGLMAPAVVLMGLLAGACSGGGAEQQLLENYFRAARLNDNTTLANIATVSFNPREQGIVQRLDVVSVSEEQTRPLRVKELARAHDEARAAADDLGKKQKAYQDDNIEAIDRVLKAERSNGKVGGRDVEVQKAWGKWREDMASYARKLSDARNELANERSVAEISVMDPRNPVDLVQFDGTLRSKNVTANATVQSPDNQTSQKTMVITLQKADLKGADGREIAGRWIVTSIKEGAAPAGT